MSAPDEYPVLILCLLALVSFAAADDYINFRYGGNINELANTKEGIRMKRQATRLNVTYYVTPCGYENTEVPEDPSIPVSGILVRSEDTILKAASLIHRMTRFMPRSLFLRLAADSSVGVFPVDGLPAAFLPPEGTDCQFNCGVIQKGEGTFDCSRLCTNPDYPFLQPNVPFMYMWAYGNLSTTFVVETNIQCVPYNPGSGTTNLLVREFGLHIMLRALDHTTYAALVEAYTNATNNNVFTSIVNEYDYFAKGTMAWFNAVRNDDLGGMACRYSFSNGLARCGDTYRQRLNLKEKDPALYNLLNAIYNNGRDYLESGTEVCRW